MKSCCITGHRSVPKDKIEYIKSALTELADMAIADGFGYFYSGFAQGADMWFAEIIAERISQGADISLEAAIPHGSRYNALMRYPHTRALLEICARVRIFSEGYSRNAYFERNRYMVDNSERIIAVYDGRKTGGTYNTVLHAKNTGREVVVINPTPDVQIFGQLSLFGPGDLMDIG